MVDTFEEDINNVLDKLANNDIITKVPSTLNNNSNEYVAEKQKNGDYIYCIMKADYSNEMYRERIIENFKDKGYTAEATKDGFRVKITPNFDVLDNCFK